MKASALAPIRSCVDGFGGRIERVLRSAELPPEILGRPDLALPLKDHYAVLNAAARETGSAQFGAEMGAAARITMLGRYGSDAAAAPTLFAAIRHANAMLNRMMQTDTDLVLFRRARSVKWSMIFHTRGDAGRYQNELLAMGYQLDLLRHFLGAAWSPHCIHVPAVPDARVSELERLFRSPVRAGGETPGIEFDRVLLARVQPVPGDDYRPVDDPDGMPGGSDIVAMARAVIQLELLCGRPAIDRVAARLQVSRRSLQRRLSAAGTTYNDVLGKEICKSAQMLINSERPIGEIADLLGYSDHAHFTRAYRRWSGFSPRDHRELISRGETPRKLDA